ncbi:hypothetical protein SAMN05444487_11384 [Marininema mesophilum]|uniref:ABC-2 type transport system permease protein n=1 Tax=Marininema mesophilum TaxID=1048340 RepID=A0A1H3AGX1_9BACL|nr:ABC transporter permease [Marininema mesophilum]SDX28977.1 hypothetical protein SAMN05444487_11384 [Marininema mesophilum]
MESLVSLRYLRSEFYKIRWSMIIGILLLGPAISLWIGFGNPTEMSEGANDWLWFFSLTVHKYTMFFYPLIVGVFAAFVCRYEHLANGWKQIFCLPVSRFQIYSSKFLLVSLLTLLTQLCLLSGFLIVGTIYGLNDPLPWSILITKVIKGWLASLPLMALMLGCSLLWKNFATPLTLNVVFILPSMIMTGSGLLGSWYPWSQPFLAMMPKHEWVTSINPFMLFMGILSTFILFVVSTSTIFIKRDY